MPDTPPTTQNQAVFDIFQWMDDGSRSIYKSHARLRKFKAGQIIYMKGDSANELFRISKGWVRVFSNRSDGREIILLLYEPGDCFGGASLIDGVVRPQTAEALTDVELEVLDRNSLLSVRSQCRSFDDALLKLLAREIGFIGTRYAHASLSPLSVRIANRILSAAPLFCSKNADSGHLTFPLSQSELASMVGASRQSVNKVLRHFQAEKLLRIEYGNLLVLDLEGLRERATHFSGLVA